MTIQEILQLDAKTTLPILMMDANPDIQDHIDQYDGTHAILNRLNKTVGTGESQRVVVTAKLVLKLQKKIVNSSVFFMIGEGISLRCADVGDGFDYLRREWDRNKLTTFDKELCRRLLIETRVAELYYAVEQTVPDEPKFRYRVKLLCLKNGDELFPHFDQTGDMDALTRRYTSVTVDAKGVKLSSVIIEVYTADQIVTYRAIGAGYEVTTIANPFGKIPAIYYEIDQPDFADVQGLIEKLEDRLSKFDDTNDYFSSPAVVLKGTVTGMPEKGEVGKMFEVSENNEGKYGDINYLTWDQTPEAMKLEFQMLQDYIDYISDTPNLTPEKMKGIGTFSGAAMRYLFLQASQKAKFNRDILIEGFTRRINLQRLMLSTFDVKYRAEFEKMAVEVIFNDPLPVDENETINNLLASVQGKIMSIETAVSQHPMIEDTDGEIARIKQDNADSNDIGLTL